MWFLYWPACTSVLWPYESENKIGFLCNCHSYIILALPSLKFIRNLAPSCSKFGVPIYEEPILLIGPFRLIELIIMRIDPSLSTLFWSSDFNEMLLFHLS